MSAKAVVGQQMVNILVAEDEPNDVLLLKRAFTKARLPATLFFVATGQEVISYLQGHSPFNNRAIYPVPDLLLLDLNMPGIGGMEVLQWLAATPELARLRVAVLSSYVVPEISQQVVQLGAQCCISKPLDPLELVPVFRDLESC